MTRKAFDSTRDQRIADDAGAGSDLLCSANGCPNRWSVDASNGRCCPAHAWASRSQWDAITQQQRAAETERAYAAQQPHVGQPFRRYSQAEKRQILAQLRAAIGPRENPRAWAFWLRDREQAGERLTPASREAWRAAIGGHATLDAARDGAEVPAEKITSALQATGDLPWVERFDVPDFDEEETA